MWCIVVQTEFTPSDIIRDGYSRTWLVFAITVAGRHSPSAACRRGGFSASASPGPRPKLLSSPPISRCRINPIKYEQLAASTSWLIGPGQLLCSARSFGVRFKGEGANCHVIVGVKRRRTRICKSRPPSLKLIVLAGGFAHRPVVPDSLRHKERASGRRSTECLFENQWMHTSCSTKCSRDKPSWHLLCNDSAPNRGHAGASR